MVEDARSRLDTIYSRQIRDTLLKRIQRDFDPLKKFEIEINGIIDDLKTDIQTPSSRQQMYQHPFIELSIRSSILFRNLYSAYKLLYQSATDMIRDDLVAPHVLPNNPSSPAGMSDDPKLLSETDGGQHQRQERFQKLKPHQHLRNRLRILARENNSVKTQHNVLLEDHRRLQIENEHLRELLRTKDTTSDDENAMALLQIEALINEKQDLERKHSKLRREFDHLQEQYNLLLLLQREQTIHEESREELVRSIGTRVTGDDTRIFSERSRSGQTPTPPPLRDLSLHGWWGGTYYP